MSITDVAPAFNECFIINWYYLIYEKNFIMTWNVCKSADNFTVFFFHMKK